jgi:hypothetical protein
MFIDVLIVIMCVVFVTKNMYHKPCHFQGIGFFFIGDLVFVSLCGLHTLHLNQVVGHASMYIYVSVLFHYLFACRPS